MKSQLTAVWMVAVFATGMALGQSDDMFPSGPVPISTDVTRAIDVHHFGNEIEDPSDVLISVSVTARLADGSPVEGAVVVTSSGGQGITDSEGVAQFTVSVASPVDALHVTALATIEGINYVGNTIVSDFSSNEAYAGEVVLHANNGCEPDWIPTFGPLHGTNNEIYTATVFDDGSGPALYIGGVFTIAGSSIASNIAKWDGNYWYPLGSGTGPGLAWPVRAMTVFDDGNGPALYVGGTFVTLDGVVLNRIGKWDGSAWSSVGGGMGAIGGSGEPSVNALTVFDDGLGGGPALYAGGRFVTAGGVSVNRIAKWDGTEWSPLGTGVSGGVQSVTSLAVFDDGQGSALYAGGQFTMAGGITVNRIAKWDGISWSALGSGVGGGGSPVILAMTVFDDSTGDGPALYVGGSFSQVGGLAISAIAKWDGVNWSSVGGNCPGTSGQCGANGAIRALRVHFDQSDGKWALFAGGSFSTIGGTNANRVARWDGISWAALGTGVTSPNSTVRAIEVFDDGKSVGDMLFVMGDFLAVEVMSVRRIAKWDGLSWSRVGEGSVQGRVRSMLVWDDGSGEHLYVGNDGVFITEDGIPTTKIARWNGESWLALGSGFSGGTSGETGGQSGVNAIAVFDDGNGPALYAGGEFTHAGSTLVNRIAKWDGESWSPLGSGVNHGGNFPALRAMAVYDDGLGAGPMLYVGGTINVAGGVQVSSIARWNGLEWSRLDEHPMFGGNTRALAVFDDGNGPALYAGGNFTTAGGIEVNHVAKWDGVTWSDLAGGVNGNVLTLTVFDDGSGPALYVGGVFTSAGGVPAARVAKWDGTSWSSLGSGIGNQFSSVRVLASHDDGTGKPPALYAGGSFATSGTGANLTKWDGTSWDSLGQFVGTVRALSTYHTLQNHERSLFVGGELDATPAGDSRLTRWGGCPVIEPQLIVHFDIRPGGCPNPFNTKSQGVVPAAILGHDDFDVSLINTDTILVMRADGVGGAVAPMTGPPGPNIGIEDVGTPFEGDTCDCHALVSNGFDDLTLKFKTQHLVAALELDDLPTGEWVELIITGELNDGIPFVGMDCVKLVGTGDINMDGVVNGSDLLILLSTWGICEEPNACHSDLDENGVVDGSDLLILLSNWG